MSTLKSKIFAITIAIVVFAALVIGIKNHNQKCFDEAKALSNDRIEKIINEYSSLSADEEVIIDPIVYRYNEEFSSEARLIEVSRCGDKTILSVIAVNLHYEELEEIGKDAFVSYCDSLSSAEFEIILLVSCHPETREFYYYKDNGLIIISLYSNTPYRGSLFVDNYTHPGYITFKTK